MIGWVEQIMDIFFMVDIFFNLVTGYYKKGNLIMKRNLIIRHYIRTWFVIDILASFPYNWIITTKHVNYWPDEIYTDIKSGEDSGSIFASVATPDYEMGQAVLDVP